MVHPFFVLHMTGDRRAKPLAAFGSKMLYQPRKALTGDWR